MGKPGEAWRESCLDSGEGMGPMVKSSFLPRLPLHATHQEDKDFKVMSALMGQMLLLVLMQVQNLHKLQNEEAASASYSYQV